MSAPILVEKQRHRLTSQGGGGGGGGGGFVPLMSDTYCESWGVNYHASFKGTYGFDQTQAVRNAGIDLVGTLGCRYIRDRMPTSTSTTNPVVIAHKRFRDTWGIRVSGHMGADRTFADTLNEARTHVNASLNGVQAVGASAYAQFEGVNEPNNDGAPTATWVNQTRNMAQALWEETRKRNSGANRLDSITVLGPGLARRIANFPDSVYADYAALGDMRAWVNEGNMHIYPAGKQPSLFLSTFIDAAQSNYAGLTLQTTEGGYFDAMNYTGGSDPTPEDINAIYLPREILENMFLGVKRFFEYEFLDDVDTSNSDREKNLGLVETPSLNTATWRRKLAWFSLRRMQTLMADPGAAFAPTNLDMNVSGGGSDFKWMLFQKRNGTYNLVMWRDTLNGHQVKVDGNYKSYVYDTVTPAAFTVKLPFTASSVRLHLPCSQGTAMASTPYSSPSNISTINGSIAGEIVVAEITK